VIVRALKAIAWSALFGFVTGAATYVVAAVLNTLYGPVFYTTRGFTEHVGFALMYGIGGLIILGAAFAISYALWLRGRPARGAIVRLAGVAFAAHCLELGIVEALAIREHNALSWPIADQLMPFNLGLFAPVGIWEGRPDAAFFWFSAALAAFVFAVVWSRTLSAPRA
jgi:hypothetical protein